MSPREESNLDQELRSLLFYPLNYKGIYGVLYQWMTRKSRGGMMVYMNMRNELFGFAHNRINKQKVGDSKFNPDILDRGYVGSIEDILPKKFEAQKFIDQIELFFKTGHDIKTDKGTVRYNKARIQNYLTNIFVGLKFAHPNDIQNSPAFIERAIRGGFENKSEEVKSWVDGAKSEANVIIDILSKNKSTQKTGIAIPEQNIVGVNNILDAMYAIDFCHVTPDNELRIVQVKTMNKKNKFFNHSSQEVNEVFDKQMNFLTKQKDLIPIYLHKNEISFNNVIIDTEELSIGGQADQEGLEKVRQIYEQAKEGYIDCLFNVEYELLQPLENKSLEEKYKEIFEALLKPQSVELGVSPTEYANKMTVFYFLKFFQGDFDEYTPDRKSKIGSFFSWLETLVKERQTKTIDLLENVFDKITLVYHIEPKPGEGQAKVISRAIFSREVDNI